MLTWAVANAQSWSLQDGHSSNHKKHNASTGWMNINYSFASNGVRMVEGSNGWNVGVIVMTTIQRDYHIGYQPSHIS
jgi:hypothetical protein